MAIDESYQTSSDLAWREVDGQVIVVDCFRHKVVVLNSVASFLWPLIDEGGSVDELVAAVIAEFRVDAPRARSDVRAFLDELSEWEFLTARASC